MKAAFGAEAIGCSSELASMNDLGRAMSTAAGADPSWFKLPDLRPWVAEIVGYHERWRYDRRFLRPKVDYSQANSTRSRGMWFWWTLESGHFYQADYQTTWHDRTRKFLIVTEDGDLSDATEEEVRAWLDATSGLTS